MVRPDPSRDLYEDLELPSNSSQDEIRKQFHKLALKYHPDRNPGKEAECSARFQTIQAANEILSDPDQRRRYDLSKTLPPTLSASGAGAGAAFQRPSGGTKGNPYKADSNFAPPPRRTGAPPPPRPAHAPEPSSTRSGGGVSNYTFERPPQPPPKPRTAAQDWAQRRNNAKAWDSMGSRREPPHASGSSRAVPPAWDGPRFPRSPQPDDGSRPSSERVPPRSAWDATHGTPRPKTSRTSSRRPNAFDPASPVSGDEGPVPMASYPSATSQQYQAPPRPFPAARNEPDRDPGVPHDLKPREQRPYANTKPETTYFGPNEEGLKRAASVKDSARLDRRSTGDKENTDSSRRPRSLSPDSRRERHYQYKADGRRPTYKVVDVDSDSSVEPEPGSYRHASKQPASPLASGSEYSDTNHASRRKAHPSPSWSSRRAGPPDERPGSYFSQAYDQGNGYRSRPPPDMDPAYSWRRENFSSNSDPNMRRTSSSNRTAPAEEKHPHFGEVYEEELPRRASHANTRSSTNEDEPFPLPRRARTFTVDESHQDLQGLNINDVDESMSEMENGVAPSTKDGANTRQMRSKPTRSGMRGTSSYNSPPAADEHLDRRHTHSSTPPADPMDIDNPSPKEPHVGGVRHVYVQPARSEWQQQKGVPSSSQTRQPNVSHSQSPPKPQGIPSLDNFRHVAPFTAPAPSGVDNLSALKDNLPFESQPSSLHPNRTASYQDGGGDVDGGDDAAGAVSPPPPPLRGQVSQLPKVPVPPSPPDVPLPTPEQWRSYLRSMMLYFREWSKMYSIFVGRFQENASRTSDLALGFTSGIQDSGGATEMDRRNPGGWAEYLRLVDEDERWRKAWNMACDNHCKAMRKHGETRKLVMDAEKKRREGEQQQASTG